MKRIKNAKRSAARGKPGSMPATYRVLAEGLRREYFFYRHGTDGVFTYVSPSIAAVLGYTRAEFLRHFSDYLTDSPVNKAVLARTRQSILGRRQPPYEVEIFHKDGGVRTLEVLEVPVRERGRVVAVEGIARDITLEKRAGEKMAAARAEAEERERLVLRHSGDGIIGTDAAGRVIFMNGAAERLLGWKPHELAGRPLHPAIHYKHADGTPYPATVCPMNAAMRRGKSSRVEGELLWRKDGSSFPVSYSAHPIWRAGKPDGAVITFQDITERKRLEESRDFLVHALVHDLNNPLAAIVAAAEMAYECPAGLAVCANREEIGIIHGAAMDMKRLLSDILDINRMESGHLRLARRRLRPSALAAAAVRPIRVLAGSSGKKVDVAVSPGLPRINADIVVLRRVLENLLGNSLKFTPPGTAVKLAAARKGKFVVFSVSDSGAGVRPENLDRIFDKYFQSDQPAEMARKGKGLGLTFCRLAVEAHGGSIKAENLAGGGCRVSFTLPADGAAEK